MTKLIDVIADSRTWLKVLAQEQNSGELCSPKNSPQGIAALVAGFGRCFPS